MEHWKKFLDTLAAKLTAILAFAILVIFLISLLGDRIPATYKWLIYLAVLGAMVIFALQVILDSMAKVKEKPSTGKPEAIEPEQNEPLMEDQQAMLEDLERVKTKEPDALSEEEAREAYLQAVLCDNRPLRLAGVDEHAGDPNSVRLSLEEMYIDLDTTTTVVTKDGETAQKSDRDLRAFSEKESRPLSVIEALLQSKNQRMVLLGFPGTGKSTFVRYLALMMAKKLLGKSARLEQWDKQPLLPIAVSLGRFAESLPPEIEKGHTKHVEDFLVETLANDDRMRAFSPHLLEIIQKEGALFLFDGLDEVANLDLRPVVVQAVQDFTDTYGQQEKSTFLVTCRTYSYQDKRWQLTNWPQHELALLTEEKIKRFVTLWYDQHTLLDQRRSIEYEQKKKKLLAALQPNDRRQLHHVARFPIILTVMAVVHASYELPDSRAQVYKQCVDLLLEKWNAKRSIMGREQTRNILAELEVPRARIHQALYEIAYEAHATREDDSSGGLVTEKLVSGVMTEYLQDIEKVGIFLAYCQKANGLLMLQGTVTTGGRDAIPRRVYTFPHLTFEEYLAGRHLDGKGGDLARELLDQAYDRWTEVIKLLAEYLCFESADRGRMNEILEALSLPFPQNPSDKDWRALWLAGELLVLYQRAFPKSSPFEQGIRANLHKLLEKAALSPRERAASADILDELGYLPNDLHTFVPIPGDPSPEFHIGRYQVTNAQYQRFLKADDFAQKEYWVDFPKFSEPDKQTSEIKPMGDWGDEGWQWLQKNWNDEKKVLPRYWNDPRFGITRKGVPVVGISWYEANAYCKWLLAHWDDLPESEQNIGLKPTLIRLPTEREWALAAGGEDPSGRYPWDKEGQVTEKEEEILRRANVRESGISRTTPVAMYPLGVSPHDVWDMGGNVWEWQANYYDNDRDFLAQRGGSWGYAHRFARVSARGDTHPGYRWGNGGFRLCVPPS
jgi:formylglycine-generating enzyme required for sulfatase activity